MKNKGELLVATEGNRRAWNASAVHHGSGADWERLIKGFATPGFSTLDDTITNCLKSVAIQGKTVVQIGCNNGRELLSAMSLGATSGLGIDQSEEFLGQAARLNAIAKTSCRFLCANVYDLPSDTPRSFDIAFITIGVLNWMPDLADFFKVVSGLLVEGGHLVIYETHPFLEMFDPKSTEPFTPSFSYFARTPFISENALVYDGSDAGSAPASYWFIHRLGDIMNGCVGAGLQIERLEEFPHSNRETEYSQYEKRQAQVPLCYTLVSRKSKLADALISHRD
jgi:SAM-dependent methyltransferase